MRANALLAGAQSIGVAPPDAVMSGVISILEKEGRLILWRGPCCGKGWGPPVAPRTIAQIGQDMALLKESLNHTWLEINKLPGRAPERSQLRSSVATLVMELNIILVEMDLAKKA